MRCPNCNEEVHEDNAVFCSRCGASLAKGDADATVPIERDDVATSDDVTREEIAVAHTNKRHAAQRLMADAAAGTARVFVTRGWLDATSAAALGFLALLIVGSLLVVGAKLQYPDLGSGAAALSVLDAIVIISLGCLGIPVDFGRVEITVIPIGALLAAGWAISWAAKFAVEKSAADDAAARARRGAMIGIPFAVICLAAASIFRLRDGTDHVGADALSALMLGALWGAVFGAVGGLRSGTTLRRVVSGGLSYLKKRSRIGYEIVLAAGVMLATAATLAVLVSLLWIIIGLATGAPSESFGPGDAGAAVIYLAAFGINVVVSLVSFSLGAPIEVGAQVTIAGRLVGSLREFSLLDWDRGGPPVYAFFVIVIPFVSCLVGGFYARRNTTEPTRAVAIMAGTAFAFALTLSLLAWMSDARLGAGLVRERGFGRVAPDETVVLVLGAVWAGAAGALGWVAAAPAGTTSEGARSGDAEEVSSGDL